MLPVRHPAAEDDGVRPGGDVRGGRRSGRRQRGAGDSGGSCCNGSVGRGRDGTGSRSDRDDRGASGESRRRSCEKGRGSLACCDARTAPRGGAVGRLLTGLAVVFVGLHDTLRRGRGAVEDKDETTRRRVRSLRML